MPRLGSDLQYKLLSAGRLHLAPLLLDPPDQVLSLARSDALDDVADLGGRDAEFVTDLRPAQAGHLARKEDRNNLVVASSPPRKLRRRPSEFSGDGLLDRTDVAHPRPPLGSGDIPGKPAPSKTRV